MILFFTIISVIITLLLGVLTLKRSATHLAFSVFCFSIVLWMIDNYFTLNNTDENLLYLIRMSMVTAVIQGTSFFLFVHTFPHKLLQLSRRSILILLLISVISVAVALSQYLITSIVVTNTNVVLIPGYGMIMFLILPVGIIWYVFILLLIKTRRASGIHK
jgi:hypothetical protein